MWSALELLGSALLSESYKTKNTHFLMRLQKYSLPVVSLDVVAWVLFRLMVLDQ